MFNPFLKDAEYYERDLEIIDAYLGDNAKYLSLMTGDPFDVCLEFVKTQVRPDGVNAFQNPKTIILDKNEYGDRTLKHVTFLGFLNRVKKQKLLLAPSMTAYLPEDVRKSTHSEYIQEGVEGRAKVKDLQKFALRDKLFEKALVFKGEQENLKQNNNSYSGATVSSATILYCKSTHSSLTSTCRTATSYANANNEKFIAGNRHYYSPEITKANFISIIRNTDLKKLDAVVRDYGFVYPTADDVIGMMLYSTAHYWQNQHFTTQLHLLVSAMEPIERAAIMYVGDLYHLYQLNKVAVRKFLEDLTRLGTPDQNITKAQFEAYDGDTKMLANFLCFDQVRGRNPETLTRDSPEIFDLIYATAHNSIQVLNQYKPMLEVLFMSKNVPSSIHAFPTSYRRAAVISDTDSTMFTMQYWVEEFFGRVTFIPDAKRLVFGLVFLVSQAVAHILAIQSANMGVSKEKLRLLAMKNEYYFAVLSMTTASKHYYASRDAQEGVYFETPQMEVKGVGLRDSKCPPKIIDAGKNMMVRIIETIKKEELIDLPALLKEVGDLERGIINSIRSGSAEYLTTGQVKPIAAYKSEENDTYKKHEFWKEVFQPNFGDLPPPPYQFVKISLVASNRTEMEAWIESIEDPVMKMRFKAWQMRTGKTAVNAMHVPASVVENYGVPEVLTRVADVRTVISNTMRVFYLLLESLGVFLSDKNNSRLISDYY
jgi:hypothetical protein